MPKRHVSLVGWSARGWASFMPSFPLKLRNYAVVVWSHREPYMLRLQLHESWSDQNFLWFKRVPFDKHLELIRTELGMTNWPDESIVEQGMKIIARGPPYVSKRWHIFWPDHQSFVEELADTITQNPRPHVTPPRLLVYSGRDALKNWDKKGPPMAVTFQSGENAVSDEWTGGRGMLHAYPGGPGRIRRNEA